MSIRKNSCISFLLKIIFLYIFLFPVSTFASMVDGTIISPDKYAWGENVGWVNFGTQNGNVHVMDTKLTGYIWDSVYGWINLSPTNAGVKNDNKGNLSGFAWSAGTGFIDFTGVVINAVGKFTGQAHGALFGALNFDCANCSVITDYRPGSSLMSPGGGFFTQPYVLVGTPLPPEPIVQLPKPVIEEINRQDDEVVPTPVVTVEKPLSEFALLLARFPTFKSILEKLNINVNKESEALKKITNVNFTLPNFLSNSLSFINILGVRISSLFTNFKTGLSTQVSSTSKLLETGLSSNDIRNFKGLSLVDLPIEIKRGVPEEVIFTRAGNANIDLPITLKVSKDGKLNKSIEVTSNKRITIIVKPKQSKKVDEVMGYLVFKSKFSLNKAAPVSVNDSMFSNLVSTAYAAETGLPKVIPEAQIEDLMVLMQFKFEDKDKDGLYVANINTPYAQGNYEIVTAIDYRGEKTPKVLRLTTLIDPEGYIYESAGINETRIRNATVTMLKQNEITGKYENWNAKDFAQKNPQITNQTGEYSFLVPEGMYKLQVQSDNYEAYYSSEFSAEEGDSLHGNIELKRKQFRPLDYWFLFLPIFLW